MNRRGFLTTGALLAGARPSPAAGLRDPLLEKVAQAALAMQRHSWEQGILAQAFVDLDDDERVVLMAKAAIVERAADGRLAAIGGGITDPGMGGAAYWRAAELSGEPQVRQAAEGLLEFVLKKAPRASDGTYYHVAKGAEMWSDSYYTTPPFLAATGHFDEALVQIEGLRKRLWNPRERLFSHIWDDERRAFRRGAFWGVGNGWAAAGMTRVIAALPAARRAERDTVVSYLREVVEGCLARQRKDALFHDVLDQSASFVETNLAQIAGLQHLHGRRRRVAAGEPAAGGRAHEGGGAGEGGPLRLRAGCVRRPDIRPRRRGGRGPGVLSDDGGRRAPAAEEARPLRAARRGARLR